MNDIKDLIESSFDQRQELNLGDASQKLRHAIHTAIEMLDSGEARVAEPTEAGWQVNEWLKKAVLLYFATESNAKIGGGFSNFYDKVPLKFAGWDEQQFAAAGVRVVPDAIARKGSYIADNVVL
ncbi:MAG: 2,3,4,5-tetrahydropyridine-2,6-dicarboxylate N-succinyltransferase, partial [Gammaproteobacteria bacterium]|nr:2,3,4,5-tetrahydropyridine-2,6-dicarboxylate N-succinyltransferase [Gammaproteobacteria bacterium]